MRFRERSIAFIANFLLGIAWASIVIGALSSFLSALHSGLLAALFLGVMGMIPGMVAVLLLEYFFALKAQQYELTKQTKLLEKLLQERGEIG